MAAWGHQSMSLSQAWQWHLGRKGQWSSHSTYHIQKKANLSQSLGSSCLQEARTHPSPRGITQAPDKLSMSKKSLFYLIFSIISVDEREQTYGKLKVTVRRSVLCAGHLLQQAREGSGVALAPEPECTAGICWLLNGFIKQTRSGYSRFHYLVLNAFTQIAGLGS